MKAQNDNKLAFAKNSLVELNNSQMIDVQGGTSPLVLTTITFLTVINQLEN